MSDNIIFMGTSKFAVPILEKISESKLNISAVYTQPPKKSSRGMRIQKTPIHVKSELLSLPIRTPNSLKNNVDEYNFIKKINPTIVVVISYGQIIPKEFLELSNKGFFNIHASILPKWRGAAPIHRAIMSGDSETGVCIMKMDAGLDTGPVVAQESTPIKADDTTSFLSERLADLGAKLLIETIKKIDELIPKPQSTIEVSYAKKIDKKEAKIDWSLDFQIIEQQIRGLSRYPGAWAYYNDEDRKSVV